MDDAGGEGVKITYVEKGRRKIVREQKLGHLSQQRKGKRVGRKSCEFVTI